LSGSYKNPKYGYPVDAIFGLSEAKNSYKTAETGRSGRRANPAANLDWLLEALMEPIGRKARRRAGEAIHHADS
jgi:hypothetical protein